MEVVKTGGAYTEWFGIGPELMQILMSFLLHIGAPNKLQ